LKISHLCFLAYNLKLYSFTKFDFGLFPIACNRFISFANPVFTLKIYYILAVLPSSIILMQLRLRAGKMMLLRTLFSGLYCSVVGTAWSRIIFLASPRCGSSSFFIVLIPKIFKFRCGSCSSKEHYSAPAPARKITVCGTGSAILLCR
jgi:hypothetical protein